MRDSQPVEIERILDEALGLYGSAEPRPGLEGRVLARVHADAARRATGRWRWVVAIPLMAAVVLVAVVYRERSQEAGVPAAVASDRPAGSAPAQPLAAASPKRVRRSRRAVKPPVETMADRPRRDVFPLPLPLSGEEQALRDLATRFPEQARQALAPPPGASLQPLEVEQIQIPPLGGGER